MEGKAVFASGVEVGKAIGAGWEIANVAGLHGVGAAEVAWRSLSAGDVVGVEVTSVEVAVRASEFGRLLAKMAGGHG